MSRSIQIIINGSIRPFLAKASGTVVSFILSVFLARALGIDQYGAYSIVIATIMVLSIPIQSGIPTLATRETSAAMSRNDASAIKVFLNWSSQIIAIYTFAVLALSLLAHAVLPEGANLGNFSIAIVAVGTISMTLRNSAVLRGLGRFSEGFYPDTLIRPTGQLILFGTLFLVAPQQIGSAGPALVAYVAASLLSFFVSQYWLKAHLPESFLPRTKATSVPATWRKGVLFLTVAGGGQVMFGNIDTLMLGALGDQAQVGAYRAAVQISMLLVLILTVVNQILQPTFAKLYLQKEIDRLQAIAAESSFLMFVMTLVLGIVLIVISGPLLGVVFGSDYRNATLSLQILAVGQILNVFFGSVGTILNMTGKEKEAVTSVLIAIVVNVALDLVLIPWLGVNGAALASAISIFVWNAISHHYVKKTIGIESSGVIHKLKCLKNHN